MEDISICMSRYVYRQYIQTPDTNIRYMYMYGIVDIYSIVYRIDIVDIVDIYRWLGARCINNQMLSWVQAAGSSGRQASLSACDRRRRYRVAGRHARGVRQCCTLLMEATHYQFLLTKSFHTL